MIGADGVIRPPAGVELPAGKVDVVVRREAPANDVGESAPMYGWLLALAREAELAAPNLPNDLAAQHDPYAHEKPKS